MLNNIIRKFNNLSELEPSFCAFIRHAETTDESPGPVGVIKSRDINPHDPPLTKMGVAQAVITGEYLQEYFE